MKSIPEGCLWPVSKKKNTVGKNQCETNPVISGQGKEANDRKGFDCALAIQVSPQFYYIVRQ